MPTSKSCSRFPSPVPFVFVGGCDRSGTTLLGHRLAEHLGGVALPESQFKRELLRFAERPSFLIPVDSVATILSRSWRFATWELDLETVMEGLRGEGGRVSLPIVLGAIARAFSRQAGIERPLAIVDHTPENLELATLLAEAIPGSRFCHIVRDGRAVFASVRSLDWGPLTAIAAADWWARKVGVGLASEVSLPPGRVTRVRYEDFCRNPQSVLSQVQRTLGLEPQPPEENPSVYRSDVPRYTRHQHELVAQPVSESRISRWKTALSSRQAELFVRAGEGMLRNLGYLDDASPVLKPVSAVGRVMNMFLEAVGWSLMKLPRRVVRILKVRKVQRGLSRPSVPRSVGGRCLDANLIQQRPGGLP